MSESTPVTPESLEYRTEVKQLLDILAHSLYTDREIFLRELISNASDALNRIQFEQLTNHEVVDPERELAIWLRLDDDGKALLIEDSGIGMNHDELIQNLGTIAHSGARAFLASAEQGQNTLDEIIGQFGVGFYSAFMVAAEVTVTSRSYRPQDEAWTWSSTGDSTFRLAPAQKAERGTVVRVQLKEDAAEFGTSWRIEQIVRKHSDYVSFPIYWVDDSGEQRALNRQSALWRQTPSAVKAEEYGEFYRQLTFDSDGPLLHVHLVADAPANVRSILFVPSHRQRGLPQTNPDHGLRLYSRKILIQEKNRDLLPDYYRFVDGVVDSEDLPLNVSREMVQSNPIMRQLRRALTGRLNRDLKALAENDAPKYETFWQEFGVFIKEGIASDPTSHEALVDLLRFHSSRSDGWTSFKDYVGRMASDQEAIYYVIGEDLRSVARSPHLDYFRAHDLEVLYLVDPIDGFMTTLLREVDGKPLQNVDDADLELPAREDTPGQDKPAPAPQDEFDALVARVRSVLGKRVHDVAESKQLVHSPCRLVSPADSYDRDLQRIRRLTEEAYAAPRKILELNRSHLVIANLARLLHADPAEPIVDAAIEQLYDNALLLEGLHANPVDMVDRIELLLEAAVASRVQPSSSS